MPCEWKKELKERSNQVKHFCKLCSKNSLEKKIVLFAGEVAFIMQFYFQDI